MRLRSKVLSIGISACLLCSTVYISMGNRKIKDRNSPYRNLRIFDPNHGMCGERQETHDYAVACMFGHPDVKHYLKNTVSTDSVLSYEQKDTIEKVLKTLVHVARKTGRAVRIKMPMHPGYNMEHNQPYSFVDAGYLSDLGVYVVEPQYWTKAHGPRGHVPTIEHVELGDDPLGKLGSIDTWGNDDADELALSLDEILHLDFTALGKIAGEMGGYSNGKWVRPFMCQGKAGTGSHKVIPPKNDPSLFASGNYFLYPS